MFRKLSRRCRSIQQTESLETRALLATITVTAGGDEVTDDGAVTLREAILAANTDTSVDGSTAGDGADTIVFDPGLNGQTIQTTSDLPLILEDLEIKGRGKDRTRIRGLLNHRGFQAAGDDINLRLEAMTVFRFQQAVRSNATEGSVTLRGVRLARNREALFSEADTRIVSSLVVNNTSGPQPERRFGVAGIDISGVNGRPQAEIIRSTIAGNKTVSPLRDCSGACFFSVDVRIDSSTFHENVVVDEGNDINAQRSKLEIDSSTFSGTDQVPGAVYLSHSDAMVLQSTFADGFIDLNSSSLDTVNSVYSGADGSWAIDSVSSSTVTASNTFISTNRFNDFDATDGRPDASGNLVGSISEPLDSMLGTLQNNGGPTSSRFPLVGSPLIDAGVPTARRFDQRGPVFGREAGATVDMGAVEFSEVRFVVTPLRTVVNEVDESTVMLEVRLETEVGSVFDLTVTGNAGSATAGDDFTAVDETLSFTGTAGETLQFSVSILDDLVYELDEEVRFDYEVSLADTTIATSPTAILIESNETSGLTWVEGTVFARGTAGDDDLTIGLDGENLTFDLNGETLEIPASSVTTLNANVLDGDNSVSIEPEVHFDSLISGGNGNDLIATATGNDTVYGLGGDDTISTGAGNDFIHAGVGNDGVSAGDGDDTLIGAGGHDNLDGGAGADSLAGQQARDTLRGGSGPDTLHGGASFDVLDGGDDNDTLDGFGTDTERGVDRGDTLLGGDGEDTLVDGAGNISNNRIEGGEGDDMITAVGVLFGDGGDDYLTTSGELGKTGARLHGGPGNDTLVGHDGDDYLEGDAGNDLMLGGQGNDGLFGGTGADTMRGYFGDDTLFGYFGPDVVQGQSGDDYIDGGRGADSLNGGGGNDVVVGDVGADTILGREGHDLLVGSEGADELFGGSGQDLIISGIAAARSQTLIAIRSEWATTERPLAVRQDNIRDGSGSEDRNNGDSFLRTNGDNQNVFDDDDADTVRGEGGTDWFFANLTQDDVLED